MKKRKMTQAEQDRLIQKVILPGICGVICISAVAGYFKYYQYVDATIGESVRQEMASAYVPLPETEPFDWSGFDFTFDYTKEELKNVEESQVEINEINLIEEVETKAYANNTVNEEKPTNLVSIVEIEKAITTVSNKVENTQFTGYDKNGNPYLKQGQSYTFGPDGYPNEAPPLGEAIVIINPNNGEEYLYASHFAEWIWRNEEIKTQSERGRLNTEGIVRYDGTVLEGRTDLASAEDIISSIKLAP